MFGYFNCNYIDEINKVSVYYRGFNFGDSIYTVIVVNKGIIIDFDGHLSSLKNDLKQLDIDSNFLVNLKLIIKKLLKLNNIDTCKCYINISRGHNIQERCHW